MRQGHKRFTKEEEDFILSNRDKFSLNQIAVYLNRTYSSVAHYNKKINNNFKYPQYRPKIEVKCSFCSNNLKRRADVKARFGRYFCDNKCKNMYHSKSIEELNSWEKIVLRMITQFGKKCWICDYTNIIQGHHIKEKRNGGVNKFFNCFLCCPNHHAEIHAGLIDLENVTKIRDEKIRILNNR
jgi:hypothetical protein